MIGREDIICAAAMVDTSRRHMAVRLACEKVNLELQRERAIKQAEEAERQHLALYQALGIANMDKAKAYLAVNPPRPSKLCQYCGRTNQKHGHTSCDGCGAPR